MLTNVWHDFLDYHDPASVVRRAHLERTLAGYVDLAPKAIMDYGCGGGRHSFLVAARWPRASVVGIDPNGAALGEARRRAAARGYTHLEFLNPTGAEERSPFDLAICFDVLEHVQDDVGALRWLSSVLKPGGLLVLHTPNLKQRRYWGIVKNDSRYAGGVSFGHVREGYSLRVLAPLLRETGFKTLHSHQTIAAAAAWLSDLDYILATRKLHPLRAFTYLGARLAASAETRRPPACGRGILVVARRRGNVSSPGQLAPPAPTPRTDAR